MTTDSVHSSASLPRGGDFDRAGKLVSEAEQMGGGEMRDNRSGATGKDSREHPGTAADWRMSNTKGSPKAGVKMPSGEGRFDRAVGHAQVAQLLA
jgi:hypothetical protein